MAPIHLAQRQPKVSNDLGAGIWRLKIGEQKNNAASFADIVRELERMREVRAATVRLKAEDVAHDAQHVPAPLTRRHAKFHAIGEKKQADFIAVLDRRKREHTRDLRREFSFALRS